MHEQGGWEGLTYLTMTHLKLTRMEAPVGAGGTDYAEELASLAVTEGVVLVEKLAAAVGKAAWSQASCSGVNGADIMTFLGYRQ